MKDLIKRVLSFAPYTLCMLVAGTVVNIGTVASDAPVADWVLIVWVCVAVGNMVLAEITKDKR